MPAIFIAGFFIKGFFMNKFYLIALFGAIVCGAYFYGLNIANEKCERRIAQENLRTLETNYIKSEQNKRLINEKVFKTGVADLRRILREKYTIAE